MLIIPAAEKNPTAFTTLGPALSVCRAIAGMTATPPLRNIVEVSPTIARAVPSRINKISSAVCPGRNRTRGCTSRSIVQATDAIP